MNKQLFMTWLRSRGFQPVATSPSETIFEKDDVRYGARMQSGWRRTRLSPNRWGAEETFKYSQRFINAEGKLDWRK